MQIHIRDSGHKYFISMIKSSLPWYVNAHNFPSSFKQKLWTIIIKYKLSVPHCFVLLECFDCVQFLERNLSGEMYANSLNEILHDLMGLTIKLSSSITKRWESPPWGGIYAPFCREVCLPYNRGKAEKVTDWIHILCRVQLLYKIISHLLFIINYYF